MFIHNKLCTGLVLAFGGLAMAANSVMAQQVDKLQRVEVTGSNIPRAGPWTLATTTNYVGSFDVTDPASGYLNCQAGIQGFNVQFANGEPVRNFVCEAYHPPKGVSCPARSTSPLSAAKWHSRKFQPSYLKS